MNAPAPVQGRWSKVEFYASYFLMVVLASVILTRLGFAEVWSVPRLDIVLGVIALVLMVASVWIARRRRGLRLLIVGYAAATQLLPMTFRHPEILLPLIGALIPVVIAIWALVALSRKDLHERRTPGS
ncbi:LrgA [Rhodanobacter glycinis]|uniref:LrgA n=1 Tax=Rhodanobacter glycinis TaxID=582702 RepID=A0A5B9DZQ2_9GAMM|nr:LrgA [Rhodanobacter glycinis]QEE25088.1 LrgA [Rhodanobacter glycinis]